MKTLLTINRAWSVGTAKLVLACSSILEQSRRKLVQPLSCFHPACSLRNTSARGITESNPPDWRTHFSAPCTDTYSEESVDCWSCRRWYFVLHTNGQLQSDIWPLDIHLVSCVPTKASKNKTKTSKGCDNSTAFPLHIITALGYGYASACPKILPMKFVDGVICKSQSTLLSFPITHIITLIQSTFHCIPGTFFSFSNIALRQSCRNLSRREIKIEKIWKCNMAKPTLSS